MAIHQEPVQKFNHQTLDSVILRIGVEIQEELNPNIPVFLSGEYAEDLVEKFSYNFPQYDFQVGEKNKKGYEINVDRRNVESYLYE